MSADDKTIPLLEKIRRKTTGQKPYGGEFTDSPAKMEVKTCPNCGSGRAKQDGLTHCAYCGFEFLAVGLSDGINIKREDNSITP